eukprot:scaffold3830_cov108-Isochrysis_galbana.AAC.4
MKGRAPGGKVKGGGEKGGKASLPGVARGSQGIVECPVALACQAALAGGCLRLRALRMRVRCRTVSWSRGMRESCRGLPSALGLSEACGVAA